MKEKKKDKRMKFNLPDNTPRPKYRTGSDVDRKPRKTPTLVSNPPNTANDQ